jgi:hypothetical protein
MIDKRQVSSCISFSGHAHVEPIADKQAGPTCGFEAIENIIQLFRRSDDDLTDRDLLPRAQRYGFAQKGSPGGYSLDRRGYLQILGDFGIAAKWYPFDHLQVVIPALRENRGVLLVGDAHCLNEQAYPDPGWHAFILTNYYTDESGMFIMGYVGIDSNFPRQETHWPCQAVEASAAHAVQGGLTARPVLVTDATGNWPETAKFYRLMKSGQLAPVA